ncbi:hypothetical protein D3C75_1168760 [compost metagenome]
MHPQLAEDAGQMGLNRGLGDAEVEGDLLVQPPGLQAFEDAQLRRRQAGDAGFQITLLGPRLAHVRRPVVARQYGLDGLDHDRQGGGLGNEAGGAQGQGAAHGRRLLAG